MKEDLTTYERDTLAHMAALGKVIEQEGDAFSVPWVCGQRDRLIPRLMMDRLQDGGWITLVGRVRAGGGCWAITDQGLRRFPQERRKRTKDRRKGDRRAT